MKLRKTRRRSFLKIYCGRISLEITGRLIKADIIKLTELANPLAVVDWVEANFILSVRTVLLFLF
jgi:hypothetical protein